MKKILCLAVLTALSGIAADKIVGGPYVVHDSTNQATIGWIVETGQASIGIAGGQLKSSPVLQSYFTTMTGLKPNTRYEYRVADQDAGKGSFKTAAGPADSFTFVAYGDNRTRDDVHRQVIATLMKRGIPDFVLQTGDMVPNGNDSSQWPVFFDIEKELLRQTAFFPALGNHERDTKNFYNFFEVTKGYYSFNWGNSHFIVLNTDIGNVPDSRSYWEEEKRWLEEDLKASQKAEFRFITGHHPPLTAVSYRQGDNPHVTELMPMFEKYRVTAAIFGHDHNYQHYLKNGIHYVVTGGGGAPLYDVDKPPQGITQKVAKTENFVSVTVKDHKVVYETIAIDGSVIDRFESTPAPAAR